MTKYEQFYDAFAELSTSEKIDLYREYQREIQDEQEWYDFDEEFFTVFFGDNTMDAVRAWHFGSNNNSWSDEYIHFNAYGNLEPANEYGVVDEAYEAAKDIFEYPELWEKYIGELDETESKSEEV